MSETNDRSDDASTEAGRAEARGAEAKKAEGQEPSLQQHHKPDTEADTTSGGPAE